MQKRIVRLGFQGSQGDELAARLDLPTGAPRAYALFAHCFTCGKDIAAASRISAGLRDEGFAVLRFDFTGLGSSEGEFANTGFSSNVEDLVAAADMLRQRYTAPSLLVGHSLGGAAVLAAAPRIPEVTAVATIAAPADPVHVAGLLDPADRVTIDRHGVADVTLAGRRFTIRRDFLVDIGTQNLLAVVGAMKRAVLLMHSPIDNVVGVDHARQIFEAARHPKSFVALDGADHLLTRREDSAYVARVLAAWASRFVLGRTGEPPPPEGHVVVEEAGTGAFAQAIRAGDHTFPSDEPLGVGDGTGPTPYDLVLAALGACTSMTMRSYADRKQINLDGVRVTLSHERRHADDCQRSEGEPCQVDLVHRVVEVSGTMDEDETRRLLAIAERCPVHRTLERGVQVRTTLAHEGSVSETRRD